MQIMGYQGVLVLVLVLFGPCVVFGDDQYCTFDNGTCGYTNAKGLEDDFDWKHVQFQKVGATTIRDHTYGIGNGSFMSGLYQPGPASDGMLAKLMSPVFRNIGCVQFYYYRTISTRGRFDVLTQVGDDTPSLVWTVKTGDAGWRFASIPIKTKSIDPIKIIFLSDYFVHQTGISAAIDDVNVTSASCTIYPAQAKDRIFQEVQGSCNFDTSMCGYNNNTSGVWRRQRSSTMTSYTGPPHDHTSKYGQYIYAEASGIRSGKKSQLVSPFLTNIQCVTFYYHMYGSQMGALNVYERVQNTDISIFHVVGNQGRRWYKGTAYISDHAVKVGFRLVFESTRGFGYKGDLALDDILTDSNCRSPYTTRGPSVAPTSAGNITMVRLVNGPSKYEGRVEVFHGGKWGTICDDSWDIEDATVICKMLGFPGAERAVKSSVYGNGDGTIWLDDVRCTGKETSIVQCTHPGWGVNNCGHGEDSGVVCQIDSNTPQNGSCTFDLNLCGYINGDRSISEFDWIRKRGSTPSSYTGPSGDVSGVGYYMYIETSSGVTGARAKLISPSFPSSTKCISFYYHMKGSDIGTLNVYVQPLTANSSLVKIWTLSTSQGINWLRGQVPLNMTDDEQFQVVFEGVRGNDYKGDIAIDSILSSNTTCDFVPTKAKFISDPNAREGDVRLVGSPNPLEGRVEIYHQEQWGTICRDLWGNQAATVVCRMLGFGTGRVATLSRFGQGTGPIWLDNVVCVGNEQSLLQCNKLPWGNHNCGHSKDTAVICSNGTSDFECLNYHILNNVDRSSSHMTKGNRCDKNDGIYPGEWHRFQGAAGQMMPEACIPVNRCGTHATGWLSGGHPTIDEGMARRKVCFHWTTNCCKWSKYIRVKNCSTFYIYEFQKPPVCQLRYCGSDSPAGPTPAPTPIPPKIKIRLAGSSKHYAGRVEVYYNAVWGTVCDDDWDLKDASVVCRMLGFTGALQAHSGLKFPSGMGKIWLDNLRCTGNEDSLWSCSHRGWGNNNCGHGEDAGVTCISDDMFSCDFESDLCGYTSSYASYNLRWSRIKATKYLTDTTVGKSGLTKCFNDWLSYNKYCYYFKHHAGRLTWHDAKRRCVGMNAWLVDIRDKEEWKFVKSRRPAGVQQYSIGIHEVNGSNVWAFYDGSIMNLTNIWASGEPNNWNSNKEDCGAMDFRTSDGKYNDIPCGKAYGFAGLPDSYVCKRPPSPTFGHYLVADLARSGRRSRGDTFSLTSSQLSNATCLSFYYNTNGTYIDNVRIWLEPSIGKKILVWQLEGNHGKQWNKAQIPLSDMGSIRFKVKFQVSHNSGKGKIIIDDVNITMNSNVSCTFLPQEARPPAWRSNGSCNFEEDTCGYTNVEDSSYEDDLNWFRVAAHHLGLASRPTRDHTTLSGSFMIMSSPIGVVTGHTGRLVSPVLSSNLVKCMIFYWYFALRMSYGVELTVYVRPAHSNRISDEIALWRMTVSSDNGQLMRQWSKGMVPLSRTTDFQVIFEGMYNGVQESVSLDDIMMSSKSCSIFPNSTAPPSVAPTTTGLRLAGTSENTAGRVEIFHQGRWGTVCGDNWNLANAHVVCRQLGFIGAFSAPCCNLFGKGRGRVWLSNLRCPKGVHVSSISNCPHNGWGRNNCTHSQDAAVICQSSKGLDKKIKLRLSGGTTKLEGRVDVHYIGVWGTISDFGWDILDATVACRQLKFAGAVGAYLGSAFGPGNGPVWFSNVGCTGNETSIARCIDHSTTPSFKPSHTADAGVECFDARLVDGESKSEGRVEINYKGKWGTVCQDKDWSINEANVICRDLGYLRAKATSSFGKGKGEIRLSGVKCKGDEASIALCSHLGWNVHNCDHSQDAGVVCTNEQVSKPVTPCSSAPCKNNGKCEVVKQSFSCQCSRNFTGQTCQTFIGSSVIGILLKGDISKWNPIKFKESIAKMLNKYCHECADKSVRTKRESEKKKPRFSSDNVIIVEDPRQSSRSPPGYLYIEFAVVKTTNGTASTVDPALLRQTINKGSADGIGGYSVIGSRKVLPTSSPSRPQVQAQTGSSDKSSLALKIGFAVVLTILSAVVIALAAMYFIRRRRSTRSSNTYILRSVGKNSKNPNVDNEVLINEDDNNLL